MTTAHEAPLSTRGANRLLPSPDPVRLIDESGRPVPDDERYPMPAAADLREMYRRMVLARRFDVQATALTRQGRLAVYPSARGQDACQVAAVMALRDTDWLFPTYRDSMSLVARGVPPEHVLAQFRGDWHSGFDARKHRVAPQATPLATQTVHAAGLAYGEVLQGRDTVAMALIGDGATSEGDFHEAVNFAGVFKSPVVFLVQNNRYAISVPLSKQTAAPALAYRGIGYGVHAEQVDGNDPAAMLAVLEQAVEHARSGQGPFVVEAHTYRVEAHTNADDPSRYRDQAEVDTWTRRDPIARLEAYLRAEGVVDDEHVRAVAEEAEQLAAHVRSRMSVDAELDPMALFEHVYATPTPQLLEQRAQLAAEIEAAADSDGAGVDR